MDLSLNVIRATVLEIMYIYAYVLRTIPEDYINPSS